MSALDEVNRLKAQRRAQIAELEAERDRQREQREREAVEILDAAIQHALHSAEAGWMLEFRTGAPNFWSSRRVVEITFLIPGHREIYLRLTRTNVEPDQWRISAGKTADDGPDPSTWVTASAGNVIAYCGDLPDALIEAEIEGWTPSKAEIVITPDAVRKAAEAWSLMFAHAMPAHIALGFVEEETGGDVPSALHALITAAVVWIGNSRPSVEASFADGDAGLISGELLLQDFARAEKYRAHLALRMCEWEVRGDMAFAGPWLEWCDDTKRAIDLCRQLVSAAKPGATS